MPLQVLDNLSALWPDANTDSITHADGLGWLAGWL